MEIGYEYVFASDIFPANKQQAVFQKIENLDALVNLEELWLGKNKITKLEACLLMPIATSYELG